MTMLLDPERNHPESGWHFDAADWRSRVLHGNRCGAAVALPDWLEASYRTMRAQVIDPNYPCFFGTTAERRGEMFYAFAEPDAPFEQLADTMQSFATLSSMPEYRRHNIAVFFSPDPQPLAHAEYKRAFWDILQQLHRLDPHPAADAQPDPDDGAWEFSFGGIEMFVVCALPSFAARHSRNLGPGMVLLFQPRSVFVDTITNKVIGRDAREAVRKRLLKWDAIPAHPDLGFYGDPGNLEWKQYFLPDDNQPEAGGCPFRHRARFKPE